MPCYKPLKGFRALRPNPSGKYSVVFNPRQGYTDLPMEVPCGQCIGCRLERSRQWAVRCMHEASLYQDNCFITLTFSDEHLDSIKSLRKEDFQKFMKRLRKRFNCKIRYYHCGEYGEKFSRPHHHACLFGFDFPDKEKFSSRNGQSYYLSKSLSELWTFGNHIIGDVTFESAAYCARYITKKITGRAAAEHYSVIDDMGEYLDSRVPEYNTMSRKPGVGKGWYDKFKGDCFPDDFVIVNGKKCSVPKYYGSQFEIESPEDFAEIKRLRRLKNIKNADNNTPQRLEDREYIQQVRLKQCNREYEV